MLTQPPCALIPREEVGQFVAKDAGATRLEHDQGHSGVNLRRQTFENVLQVLSRLGEEPEVIERTAAADVSPGQLDIESGGGQNLPRGVERRGVEVVVPGIGPEKHRCSGAEAAGWCCPKSLLEASPRKARQLAFGRDSRESLDERTQTRSPERKVRQSRRPRGHTGPAVHEAEGIVRQGMNAAGKVMGQKFGLPRRHIHVDRTFGFAGFAGETQIERLFHFLVAPAAGKDIALQHLPQQVRAAPGGVFLLERDHVAGAHRSVVLLAAGAHADTAQRGFAEGTVVCGELEPGFGLLRLVARAQTKVVHRLIDGDRIDELSRIHAVLRIPQGLELAECLHQIGAKHLGQQGGPGLTVAVFARERAAMSQDDVGGLIDEAAVFGDALRPFPDRR